MHLHCPKCGDLLVEDRETLYCRRGDMEFSRMLDQRYRRHFGEKIEPAPDVRLNCKVGGDWFCPECGQKMEELDGRILCHCCGVNLAAFVRHLIELHPHKTEIGSMYMIKPNEFTGANAGGRRLLATPTSWATRIAQFWR